MPWRAIARKSIAAGMDDHISKPVRSEELARVLEHYLTKSGDEVFNRVSEESRTLVDIA